VGFSTLCWLIVTFLTRPTSYITLNYFYHKVRPGGWWKPISGKSVSDKLTGLTICWLSAVVMVYACLFFIGDMLFKNYTKALVELALVILTFVILRFQLKRTAIFDN
jgi:hypothetical protein